MTKQVVKNIKQNTPSYQLVSFFVYDLNFDLKILQHPMNRPLLVQVEIEEDDLYFAIC